MDSSRRRLVIEGQPGPALGVPVFGSYRFLLNRELGGEGRYLRALASAIDDFSYDPVTGQAEFLVDAYCSHSSFIEEGDLQVEYEAGLSLLQVDDTSGTIAFGAVRGEEGTGLFEEEIVP